MLQSAQQVKLRYTVQEKYEIDTKHLIFTHIHQTYIHLKLHTYILTSEKQRQINKE